MEKSDQARKDDHGKLRFDLIPPGALKELAAVYTVGAAKYGDRNWEKGLSWGRVFAAIQRHLWAFWGGEEVVAQAISVSGGTIKFRLLI